MVFCFFGGADFTRRGQNKPIFKRFNGGFSKNYRVDTKKLNSALKALFCGSLFFRRKKIKETAYIAVSFILTQISKAM